MLLCTAGEKVQIKGKEKICPDEGFFNWNANLAFDRNGKLVAKYWKTMVCDLFDQAKPLEKRQLTDNADTAIWNTDFGVHFATFICADIFNPYPAKDFWFKGIRNFAYGLRDGPKAPFFYSFETHEAWSRLYESNIIVSNSDPISGAGVYSNGHVLASHLSTDSDS